MRQVHRYCYDSSSVWLSWISLGRQCPRFVTLSEFYRFIIFCRCSSCRLWWCSCSRWICCLCSASVRNFFLLLSFRLLLLSLGSRSWSIIGLGGGLFLGDYGSFCSAWVGLWREGVFCFVLLYYIFYNVIVID